MASRDRRPKPSRKGRNMRVRAVPADGRSGSLPSCRAEPRLGYPRAADLGGIRFGVGSLAHLLKNRFYISEITYRGEVHRGEHEPILPRDLFEAVQAKRVSNAVARHVRLRGSAALLAGCLFDDRGN